MQKTEILGVDIGGGGIKAAVVEVHTGAWRKDATEWFTIDMLNDDDDTDKNDWWYEIENDKTIKLTPEEMRRRFEKIVAHFDWKGAIGIGFPSIVQNGTVKSASNIHQNWLGIHLPSFLSENLPNTNIVAINDADAAGLGEMAFGSGRGIEGSVLVLTVGTGIGSALFVDGRLVPNTEFGHFFMKIDKDLHDKEYELAEDFASSFARRKNNLKWKEWAGQRFKEYLRCMQRLLSPECVIIGGGASKERRFKKYLPELEDTDFDTTHAQAYKTNGRSKIEMNIIAAKMQNYAGLIGAAVAAKSLEDLQHMTDEI